MNDLENFLQSEICSQGMYDVIVDFICSPHIRSGEFEGNEHIIKKMDQLNYVIFREYDADCKREIVGTFSIGREHLLKAIDDYAKRYVITLKKHEDLCRYYN